MRFSCIALLLPLVVMSGALAQMPDEFDSLPPESVPVPVADAPGDGFTVPSAREDEAFSEADPQYGQPSFEMCDCQPLDFESTGTWLRRGFWYAETDAVIMNRFWNRDPYELAFDATTSRTLQLDGKAPGAEGSVRLALGRFLFRDQKNRDHQLEFNVFGGGEWVDNSTASSLNANQLFVNPGLSGGNSTFNNASSMQVTYGSQFQSYELNYRVRGRMKRDRMELDPSGQWTRVADPQITKHFLVGLRLFSLDEDLNWTAQGVRLAAAQGVDQNGLYTINTTNRLIGPQFGGGLVYDRDRWSIEVGGKAGVYLNSIDAQSSLTYSTTTASNFNSASDDFGLSFLGEYTMVARWHLRPNVSLRAGWEMMYVTSTALAPGQITFAPNGNRLANTGDPFYHGALFGIEGFW